MSPYLENARELGFKIKYAALRALPIILFGAGLVLLAAALYVKFHVDPEWGEGLVTVAIATISSGVFSAVAKSLLFTEMYQKAVQGIVYGRQLLGTRNDIGRLWSNVSEVLAGSNFPDLNRKVHREILDHYLNDKFPYYFRNVHHTLTYDWEDRERCLVTCVSEFRREIVACSDNPITLTSEVKRFHSSELIKDRYLEFSVDGRSYLDACKVPDTLPLNQWFTTAEVVVEGKRRYAQQITKKYQIDLRIDPVLKFKYRRYADCVNVHVRCIPDDLIVTFESLGTVEDFRRISSTHVNRPNDRSYFFDSVVFPQQGYVVSCGLKP